MFFLFYNIIYSSPVRLGSFFYKKYFKRGARRIFCYRPKTGILLLVHYRFTLCDGGKRGVGTSLLLPIEPTHSHLVGEKKTTITEIRTGAVLNTVCSLLRSLVCELAAVCLVHPCDGYKFN